MKIILFFLTCSLVGCAAVQTASNRDNAVDAATVAASTTPKTAGVQPGVLLKPVIPDVKLTSKQQKYLNESLPRKVRKILENAASFEIFAEVGKDETTESDSRNFVPNIVAVINSERQKKEILEAFYLDAAREDAPAVCYEPHHSLRATFEGKTVEVEICFSCSKFVVKDTDLRGTIVRENRRSEDLLTQIVHQSGIKIER